MRRSKPLPSMRTAALACVLAAGLLALGGCGARQPVVESREALATVVTITAYGDDEAAVRSAIEDAYAAMDEVAAELDAYDPTSALSRFNAQPYAAQELSALTVAVLDEIDALGVSDAFSPGLLAVSGLYHFEESGTVPPPADVTLAVRAAARFTRTDPTHGAFMPLPEATTDARLAPGGALAPGLDLGGAAKGLALDRARQVLQASGAVRAAIVSSGSSTVTLGTKPDGTAWRIGIEDPRDPDTLLATASFEGSGALSTSGDYQRYFEAGGVRYHHILDPTSGLPAGGVRSLTVAGSSLSGLESDILSTALFVMAPAAREAYAGEHGLGMVVVDAEGRTLLVPAPAGSGMALAEEAP